MKALWLTCVSFGRGAIVKLTAVLPAAAAADPATPAVAHPLLWQPPPPPNPPTPHLNLVFHSSWSKYWGEDGWVTGQCWQPAFSAVYVASMAAISCLWRWPAVVCLPSVLRRVDCLEWWQEGV